MLVEPAAMGPGPEVGDLRFRDKRGNTGKSQGEISRFAFGLTGSYLSLEEIYDVFFAVKAQTLDLLAQTD